MLLGVNIDHIATLRNARGGGEPSVLEAALICKKLEVNGVTVHLREDRRHIKDSDLKDIKNIKGLRINLEMAVTDEMQAIALEYLPECCCIVPEKRQELTTEGGLDVAGQLEKITSFVKPLADNGIIVSLFIDPDVKQVEAAAKTGAQFIELHTGQYAEAYGRGAVGCSHHCTATSDEASVGCAPRTAISNEEQEFQRLKQSANLAKSLGLRVNAGHGLNYENVKRMHEIPELEELNIGHSIISRAIFVGLENAISEMTANLH